MENSIMNIEKRNLKMFNTIAIIVLAAVLLTAVGGIIIQRQDPPLMGGRMPIGRSGDLLRPESTQTSPTGSMVMNTGIILLLIGFSTILVLLVRRNLTHHNPS